MNFYFSAFNVFVCVCIFLHLDCMRYEFNISSLFEQVICRKIWLGVDDTLFAVVNIRLLKCDKQENVHSDEYSHEDKNGYILWIYG